jgi:hypothetical protein
MSSSSRRNARRQIRAGFLEDRPNPRQKRRDGDVSKLLSLIETLNTERQQVEGRRP